MKKKILSILLIGICLLGLTGCGNNKKMKATIITNNGETVSMSAKELMEIYDENNAKFNKDYRGAKITFTGTIKSVETKTSVIVEEGSSTTGKNRIIFEEGFCLVLDPSNTKYDLADYNKGDKLEITTGIADASDTKIIEDRVVWLIGDDKIKITPIGRMPLNDIETTITKK